MVFGLFRRPDNERVIERLHAGIVAAARAPALYIDLAVDDTFDGRFECLILHVTLVACRLRDAESPGPDMAQHLVDTTFRHFDRMLREQGVGDTSVPKRMKQLAEAFLGRSAAYELAFRQGAEALAAALRRNVYRDGREAAGLTAYVQASRAALAATPLQAIIDGALPFPDPAAIATTESPREYRAAS
jgi:cytochrome b pre-mRNA-processing protein 3